MEQTTILEGCRSCPTHGTERSHADEAAPDLSPTIVTSGGIDLEQLTDGISTREGSFCDRFVNDYDWSRLVVIALVLLAASLAACWVPAWQATRVDPLETLRAE